VVLDITRTTKKMLSQTNVLLKQAGSNVLGYVVNKQRRSREHAAYPHYYKADVAQKSNHGKENQAFVAVPTNITGAANFDPPGLRRGE